MFLFAALGVEQLEIGVSVCSARGWLLRGRCFPFALDVRATLCTIVEPWNLEGPQLLVTF